jgi:hypothetical protein
MEIQWAKALRSSLTQVFSTMFFMVPEADPELTHILGPDSAQGWYEGGILFTLEGKRVVVMVWTPPALAAELAANILAQDAKSLGQDDILDAFKEMLNMVAGGLLTNVDPEGVWRMGLPMARVLGAGTVKAALARASETMAFEVEGRPLLAGLTQA